MIRTITATFVAIVLFSRVDAIHAAPTKYCASPADKKATAAKTATTHHTLKLSRNEQRLINAVNEYRADRGLTPLKVDPALMNVARHAAPHYSHVIGGKMCWHRAHAAGFRGWATDNIANGCINPEHCVQAWARSDGHARQMRGYFNMNSRWSNYNFNRIGVGVCGNKYIAVFGREATKAKSAKSAS